MILPNDFTPRTMEWSEGFKKRDPRPIVLELYRWSLLPPVKRFGYSFGLMMDDTADREVFSKDQIY